MSGIFGILNRNGAPLALSALEGMTRSLAHWPDHKVRLWQGEIAGFGVAALCSTPEAARESLPRRDAASGIAFAASGRLDNRDDLVRSLGRTPNEVRESSDGELMLQAYLRWGEQAPQHLLGDWTLAAWNQAEHLARDQMGNSSLFYYGDGDSFVFAPTRQALMDMNLFPAELDEFYLAQLLVDGPTYDRGHTVYRAVRSLPPAHSLTIAGNGIDAHHYWRMEDIQEVHWSRRHDYVEAFTSVFDLAVRSRLRVPHTSAGVASTMGGGLDSCSVTASAAAILEEQNRRLAAFISLPLTDPAAFVGDRFGDGYPFAAATAQFAGNVDLVPVLAENISPIQSMRDQLEVLHEPSRGGENAYWISQIYRAVHSRGIRVLLTGQQGNGGMSWTGDLLSQPVSIQLRHMKWGEWYGAQFRLMKSRKAQRQELSARHQLSAIRSDFAKRLNLLELQLSDPDDRPARDPLEHRFRILKQAQRAAASCAETGAAHGVEVRDPTADARVIEFVLSVPDEVFIDPQTGSNRWLLREAMNGRLPDEVRLNRRRVRKAADLVPRLRACAAEVDESLDELEEGAASAYLDLPHMRLAWELVKTQDTPEALRQAVTVLTRAIGIGLFVNQFVSRPAVRSKAAAAYTAN